MKHNMVFTKKAILFPLLLLGFIFTTSCIKDDLGECSKLTLKVVNDKGDDITPLRSVKGTTLYVFDETLKFLDKHQLDEEFIVNRKEIRLDYPEGKKLHLIAWGNLSEVNQNISESTTADEMKVLLKASGDGLAASPDSLFYGAKEVVVMGTGVAGGNQEIILVPKTGTISMETVGLQYALNKNRWLRAAQSEEPGFYMNKTLGGFDYKGEQVGDSVYYNPDGQWNETASEWITVEPKNACEGDSLSCAIQIGGQELEKITEARKADGTLVPISVAAYQNTHIVFEWNDQGAFIGARIIVTPWGEVIDNPDLKPKN